MHKNHNNALSSYTNSCYTVFRKSNVIKGKKWPCSNLRNRKLPLSKPNT
jgi:hypothetical protein